VLLFKEREDKDCVRELRQKAPTEVGAAVGLEGEEEKRGEGIKE